MLTKTKFQIDPTSLDLEDFVGLPLADGIDLTKAESFALCRICGAVYVATMEFQQLWLDSHNDLHTPQEHYDLEVSHRFLTTEAFTALERKGIGFNV